MLDTDINGSFRKTGSEACLGGAHRRSTVCAGALTSRTRVLDWKCSWSRSAMFAPIKHTLNARPPSVLTCQMWALQADLGVRLAS